MWKSFGRLVSWLVSHTVPCLVCSRRLPSTGLACVSPELSTPLSTLSLSDPTAHFSENWGFVAFSPLIGGNLFSVAFGWNLDKHSPDSGGSDLPPTTSPDTTVHAQCMDGVECYIWSLGLTTWMCILAFGLAVWAGYRDWKKSARGEKDRGYRPILNDP